MTINNDAVKHEEKQERVSSIVESVKNLPTLPIIVSRVIELLGDEDVAFTEVGRLVTADPVLSAKIIKLINSSFYGLRFPVSSLKQAVVYLGIERVLEITLTTSLINLIKFRNTNFKPLEFWGHSLACGLISRMIAQNIGYKNEEQAYLGGLIHDIGKIVISECLSQDFEKVIDIIVKEGMEFYHAEERVLQFNHCEVGRYLGEQWGFSEDIVEVIELHHCPRQAQLNSVLVSIVNLADTLCKLENMNLGYYENMEVVLNDLDSWKILEKENGGLHDLDIEKFTYELEERIEETKSLVHLLYS